MLRSGMIGVLVLGLVLGTSVIALGSVGLKIGYDNYGYLDESGVTSAVKSGYSLAIELINDDPESRLEWGCGLSFETEREIKNSTEKLQFNPVYIFLNYNMTESDTTPYFTLRLGSDLEGLTTEPYYAAGIGVNFSRHMQIEAVYSVNNGDIGNYSRTSLNFGFRF
jgi:hypothetical protein